MEGKTKLENSFFELQELCEREKTRFSENVRKTLLNKLISTEITIQNVVSLCENLKSIIDEITICTRSISYNFITPDFQHVSFPDVLKDYIHVLNFVVPEIEFSFKDNSVIKWENLCTTKLTELYRIIQEAIRNCIEHSKAQNVRLTVSLHESFLDLTIKDDGKGFDTKSHYSNGIGLHLIKSRISIIEGSVSMSSKLGEGTEIKVSYPYPMVKINE